MSQLTNSLQSIIDAASVKAASAQVTNIAKKHEQKANNSGKRFVLADISASMAEQAGSATKYDLLKKALGDPAIDWTLQQLIEFNSFANKTTPGTLSQPSGNTALHKAIEYISTDRPAYTLIISDGQPDDKQAALQAASKLTGVIDVLFIGSEGDFEAIAFLRKLATCSGGKMSVRDLQKTKSLPANTIKALLLR